MNARIIHISISTSGNPVSKNSDTDNSLKKSMEETVGVIGEDHLDAATQQFRHRNSVVVVMDKRIKSKLNL